MDCNDPGVLEDAPALSGFQSPNHRGVDCNPEYDSVEDAFFASFSPLIIGEWTATQERFADRGPEPEHFQSPNHRGVDCNWSRGQMRSSSGVAFSPLIIGEWTATG